MKLQLVERNPLNFSVWPVILVTALQITPLATTSLSFYQIGLTASTSLLFRALLETRASQDANEKLGLSVNRHPSKLLFSSTSTILLDLPN